MTEEMLHAKSKIRGEYDKSFVNDTVPVAQGSEISERFHQIKAIEEGGLPIEIVSIVPSVSYQPHFAYSANLGRVNTGTDEDIENINDEYFEKYDDSTVFYFGVKTLVDFKIYYNTAFDQMYRCHLEHKRQNRWCEEGLSLLSGLLGEVDASGADVSTVDDIGRLSSVEATFMPDEDLTSGKIEVCGEKAGINNCEKVDFIPSTRNADSYVRFVVGDDNQRFDSNADFDIDWIWSYISDVRTKEDDDTVVLTVETPIGKAVFPYELTHNTDTKLWRLVEEAGGSLTDLRGMDICIRKRWRLAEVFSKKDIRKSGYPSHCYPDYGKDCSEQPIQTPNDKDNPTVIDDPTDVRPVGVDARHIWTLGVPPYDRFHSRDANEISGTDSDKSEEPDGLIESLKSIVS